MLTPAFNLTQNENFLLLKIKAPYTKLSETEIFFEGTDVRFYSKPYYLRLHLPGRVSETGSESATYDVDEGSYFIQMPKECPGEWFEGLDLQTKLLAPKGKISCGPLIEVLKGEGNISAIKDTEDDDDFDWEIYQNQYTEESVEQPLPGTVKYGFASQRTDFNLFSRIQEEMPDLLDVHVDCGNTVVHRQRERTDKELKDFSEEHYLADLYETEDIQRILSFSPAWNELEQKLQEDPSMCRDSFVIFSEEEKAKMRKLPNKEYILDHATKQEVLLSLVDILLAYAYNVRTTEGENTVESGWTICKLSSTLSWLETSSSLESVVVSFVRRSLCYPLYRHWRLALTVVSDTLKILTLGPRFVLKCLLEIHDLFIESDPRYILNDLYITDYCVWIQSVRSKVILKLAEALKKISVSKSCVDLDLPELEQAADLVLEAEQRGDHAVENISKTLCQLDLGGINNQTDCSSDSPEVVVQPQTESSGSDSSEDESSSSLDSDDYSSSEYDDSSDSDDDDDDDDNESDDNNEGSAENCLLLGNIHSLEKIR